MGLSAHFATDFVNFFAIGGVYFDRQRGSHAAKTRVEGGHLKKTPLACGVCEKDDKAAGNGASIEMEDPGGPGSASLKETIHV